MNKYFLIILISLSSMLKADNLYFTIQDSKNIIKEIKKSISSSKLNIKISSYHLTNKSITKSLKNVSKKGVKVTIIFDQKNSNKKYSLMRYLAKYKNFNIYIMDLKWSLHQNYIIIDNKLLIFGSANLSKSAFLKNLEYIFVSKNKSYIRKFNKNFLWLISHSKLYD
jgi:phosphatidylserine/phosphatidylglycerophosphate/cardiolipin synthase-like enzyme